MNNKFQSVKDIGIAVRQKRKDQGLKLATAASLCGVGYRFMSDLENGKETVRLNKVLQVLQGLGLELHLDSRRWPE